MTDDRSGCGLFLSFEGIDGSGKSTQIELLRQYLEDNGHTVRVLREPGGTVVSEKVRELLLDPAVEMTAVAELLLFSSARAQMVREVVQPALEREEIVVCDRYVDSSTAYQGFGRQLGDHEWIFDLHEKATHNIMPDRTYVLDIPIEAARLRRGGSTPDRMESGEDDFYGRVKEGYEWLIQQEPARFLKLDGTCSVRDIHQKIVTDTEVLLANRSGTGALRDGSST